MSYPTPSAEGPTTDEEATAGTPPVTADETPSATDDTASQVPETGADEVTAPAPTDTPATAAHAPAPAAEAAEAPSEAAQAPTEAPAEAGAAPAEHVAAPADAAAAPTDAAAAPTEAPADAAAAPTEAPADAAEQAPADNTATATEPALAPAEQAPPAPEAEASPAAKPHATAEPVAKAEADATPDAAAKPEADAKPDAAAAPSPAPKPSAVPKPSAIPKPSAVPRPAADGPGPTPAAAAVVAPALDDAKEAAEAAAWGRVDPDGTVWVREAGKERSVGQYTGADSDEALGFYVRRFLEIQAQLALFEARLSQLAGKEIDQTLETLTESLAEPAAVGDIDGLRRRLETLRGLGAERKAAITAEREAAREKALAERTAIVERAEAISALDPDKVHWRSSGDELRGLLDQWKAAQRSGPRLTRSSEDALWKRFSRARTTFDRNRGHFFSELDTRHAEAKRAKEKLIERAEALSSSTDWGATSAAYRGLMDEWKASARANRKEDDALWARFRAAQQVFFDARNEDNAKTDAEFAANLEVKMEILEQAEALLPVKDPNTAKAALRPLQEKWEEAGKVPRADVQRVEGRMRAVEQAIRDADAERWHRTDPEKQARAEGMAAQLHDSIAELERELATAKDSGDARAIKRATEALETRQAWLTQVLRATD